MYNYDDNADDDDDDDDAGKKVKVGDILKLTTCSPAASWLYSTKTTTTIDPT